MTGSAPAPPPATSVNRKTLWRTVVPVLYMGLIYILSSRPLPISIPGSSDKVAHFGAFALMAWLWIWALGPLVSRSEAVLVLAIVVSAFYGGVDEWHQRSVPGRTCDILDAAADGAGALAAAGLVWVWFRLRGKPTSDA